MDIRTWGEPFEKKYVAFPDEGKESVKTVVSYHIPYRIFNVIPNDILRRIASCQLIHIPVRAHYTSCF